MPVLPPINLKRWIDEHRDLLKPPVGNKMVWQDSEFMVMVVGGPNQRKDFHVEDGEELFYQVEGDIVVRIIEDGKVRDVPIREGEMFLLPPGIPHSPQRPANTVGLVIERRRAEDEQDHLRWFCEKCGQELHDAEFQLVDLGKQLKPIIEEFYADRAAPDLQALRARDVRSREPRRRNEPCDRRAPDRPPHPHPAGALARPEGALRLRRLRGARPLRALPGADGHRRQAVPRDRRQLLGPGPPPRRMRSRSACPCRSSPPCRSCSATGPSPADGLDLSRILNDHIAEVVAAHPRRFIGLGTVPMQDADARDPGAGALRRASWASRACRSAPTSTGSNLDDPALFPVFEAAAELGAAVFVHPWDMLGKERMTQYWLPWLVGMPTETTLAIALGDLRRRARAAAAAPDRVRARRRLLPRHVRAARAWLRGPPRPGGRPEQRRASANTSGGSGSIRSPTTPTCCGTCSGLIGADRVALGSDYPFPLGEDRAGRAHRFDERSRRRARGGGSSPTRRSSSWPATGVRSHDHETGVSREAGFAEAQDAADPLASYREEFEWPVDGAGRRLTYLVGNSLGLLPEGARAASSTRSWMNGRAGASRAT